MKKISILLNTVLIILFLGCKKDNQVKVTESKNAYFDSGLSFLKSNLSFDDYDKLDLQKYNVLRYRNKNIGAQIFLKNTQTSFLMIEEMGNNFSGNWVDMSHLKTIHPKYETGVMFLQSLDKKSKKTLIVDSNLVIKVFDSSANGTKSIRYSFSPKGTADRTGNTDVSIAIPFEVLPEIVIYGSPGGSNYNFASLFWLTSGNYDYWGLYYSAGGGGSSSGTYYGSSSGSSSGQGSNGGASGGGSQNNNVTVAPTFFPPDEPIVDLVKELKCFTVIGGSTYNISVNVNQPFPNSRDVLNPRANFMVGHAFLTLEQHNTDGSTIIRNVGFYPKHGVKPGDTYDQGIFGDDSYTPFDVSLKFDVTGAELSKVINSLLDQLDVGYDLNTFNCTNSPMTALSSINIKLPSTKATEVIFTGNSPADLGEDIRYLNMDTFSAANGNRKVVRTVSNSNNLKPLPKKGTC